MKKVLFLMCICFSFNVSANQKLKVLYNSLDPYSISQHLAFYELYPDTFLGQQALKEAWQLLAGQSQLPAAQLSQTLTSHSIINSLVALINKTGEQELPILEEQDLLAIETLAAHLPHQRLKGHQVTNEKEVLELSTEEIDLARGLFLGQFGSQQLNKVRSYEALIDLMALQILARLPPQATPELKIRMINTFIFDEMGFRFPPHSLYAKDIDLYTFLPSVLDSQRGVCLGVSILYLCLAQRLSLNLEMITPPGHIYVRYCEKDTIINIETTARGVHIDCKDYLGIDTRSLQQRCMKEIIGLAYFNQAAVFLQEGHYTKALDTYIKAEQYVPDDALIKEFLGYAHLFVGQLDQGEAYLEQVRHHVPDYAVAKNTIAEDYLQKVIDIEGLKVVFHRVDEDRTSILAKKDALEKIVERCPHFRAGILQLAVTWLQLHRTKEALEILARYDSLDSTDPEVNYYLAVLYGQRHMYQKAWHHLQQAERIVHRRQHDPKALKDLRLNLATSYPEPRGLHENLYTYR